MLRNIFSLVLIVLMLFCFGCSDKSSSARISFKDAIAPASALGEKTKVNKFGSDDLIIDTLNGKSTEHDPKRSYSFLYDDPTLIASIQCCSNPAEAKKEFSKVVDTLAAGHPFGLETHKDLKMKVPAIGFWKVEPDSPKQIIFRYGNVLIIIQTMYSSTISVESVQKFADAYVRYLDGVPGAK